jgi:hypothetical protein
VQESGNDPKSFVSAPDLQASPAKSLRKVSSRGEKINFLTSHDGNIILIASWKWHQE